MNRPSKKILQRAHAKTRFRQRLGMNINRHEYRDLVEKIQKGEFKVVWRQAKRISHYRGIIKGIPVILIYDHYRTNIVTVFKESERYYDNLKKWEKNDEKG